MSKVNIPLLMDEPPISVYPSLAKALGDVNKAIIVQQLHFLLSITRGSRNQYNYVDGYWWVYNTYEEWHAIFTWVSIRTLKTLFKSLEESGIVKSISGVKNKLDRRKWYRIDYEKLAEITLPIVQKLHDEHSAEVARWEVQKLHDVNRNTETTTERNTGAQILRDDTPDKKSPLTKSHTSNSDNLLSENQEVDESSKIELSKSEVQTANKKPRRIDPHFDVIAEVWGTTAGGYISNLQGMIFCDKKVKGDWLACQFDVPATVEEVRAFGIVAKRNPVNKGKMPVVPSTIQRQFYEFRVSRANKIIQYADGYIPVEERTSVLDSVRVV